MNTDDNIAFIAITIGLAQMMMLTNKLINTKDISYYSLEYVLAGILASTPVSYTHLTLPTKRIV